MVQAKLASGQASTVTEDLHGSMVVDASESWLPSQVNGEYGESGDDKCQSVTS